MLSQIVLGLNKCGSKERWLTVVKNEKNELISTRTITGWRVCIHYTESSTKP